MSWLYGVKKEEAWCFSVMNVTGIIKENTDRRNYWNKLKQTLKESGNGLHAQCSQLKILAFDEAMRMIDISNIRQCSMLFSRTFHKEIALLSNSSQK